MIATKRKGHTEDDVASANLSTVRRVAEPKRSRPFMPGYLAPDAGGTLDWDWALRRLTASHTYWLSTVRPDGRPHLSPVWGVWLDDGLWFSCSPSSRKARNLAANPSCVMATDDPLEPVVLEGTAARVTEREDVVRYVDAERVKYADEWNEDVYTVEFFEGGTYRVTPVSVIALDEKQFSTSPTRWTFSS